MTKPQDSTGVTRRLRIGPLDGIRGVAAIYVVLAHALGSPGFAVSAVTRAHLLAWGHVAVDLFFCMSGYLITRLVINERERTGTVDLMRFYKRRALRVFPAYYGYVLCVVILGAFGYLNIPWQQTVQALTFTRDLFPGPALAFGILWSICVEEKFYTLWPPIYRRFSPEQLKRGLLVVIAIAPLVRAAVFYGLLFVGSPSVNEIWRLPTGVLDVVALGCLLALAEDDPRFKRAMAVLQRPIVIVAAAALIWVGFNSYGGLTTEFGVGPATFLTASARAFFAFLMIHRFVTRPRLPVGRFLTVRPLVVLGAQYSYSLYLWHVIFINPVQEGWLHTLPFSLAPVIACTVLSRKLFEEPFLRLRRRQLPEVAPV